jgi:putative redox protein|tara:strand:- start:74 stop:502 length:429 start_codon:yes stop_codon:yes gene_type:complete
MKVELEHQNGFHSEISNYRGHRISIDTSFSEDPQGPSPMELLLMGVAGCSSIDIISILNKQKIKPDSLHIQVDGDRVKGQVPSLFTDIHAKVIATGDVPANRLYRAAQLSFEKYCSVSKTLEHTATITFSVAVNGTPYEQEK